MAYIFDQIFAVDESNPQNVARNASVLLYEIGDATKTPVTITTPAGEPLPNPVIVNANGFGPIPMHQTLDSLAWEGGGHAGVMRSYEGMKDEAVAARAAAETAASEAAAAESNAAESAAAAANSAALVGAPADTAVQTLVNGPTTETRAALNAIYGRKTHVVVGPGGDYATLADAYAANTAGNVDIELTAGTHALAAALTPVGVKNVTIRGQGRGTTLNCAAGFINASGSSDAWEIYGLTVKRNDGTNTNDGIVVDYPRRWSVRHLTMQGFGGSSIKYKGGVHSEIAFNYILAEDSTNTNGLAGVHVLKADGVGGEVATTIRTVQNYVGAGVQYGFLFDGTTIGSTSEGDVAEGCAVGFRFQVASMQVISPYTEGNTVGIEMFDSQCPIIGKIRDNPVVTWSGVGFFDRRITKLAGHFVDPGKGLLYGGSTGGTSFDTSPSLRWDTSDPNGRLTAPVGAIAIRTDGAAGGILHVKESGTGNTGWIPVGTRSASTTLLTTAANAINTSGKQAGVQVFNTTLNRPVWATGSAATSTWVFADGTTAHTPA